MKSIELTNRQRKIIYCLVNERDWLSSIVIAKKIGCSDRTIRNEVIEINSIFKNENISIVSERSKGFKLDCPENFKEKLLNNDFANKESNEELHISLLKQIITSNKPCNIDDLCFENYISRSSFEEKLKKMKYIIRTYGGEISLCRKNNTLKIIGDEKNIRQLLNFIITNNEHGKSLLEIKNYNNIFDQYSLNLVQQIVYKELKNVLINMSDQGVIAISIHVLISIERIRKGYILKNPFIKNDSDIDKDNIERLAANNIAKELSKEFNIKFNENEIDAIAYYIAFRRYFINDEPCDKDDEVVKCVTKVIEEIRDTFSIDMTKDSDLINGLSHHFEVLRQRIDMKIYYQNPILEDLKDKYPFMFEVAIFARRRFVETIGIDLNEDEVGFIAIHLGASFERFKNANLSYRVNIALVSHLDYPSSQFLITKLRSSFGSIANIFGPFSNFDLNDLFDSEPQLIITTSDLTFDNNICPVVKINPVITRKDINYISDLINKCKSTKIFKYEDFFRKDLFFKNANFNNKNELISFLTDKLEKAQIVDSEYRDSVFKREEFSSTILLNGIAVPHSTEVHSYVTNIAVALLDKPIVWSKKRKARIVFMMAVAEHDQYKLQLFYEFIVDLSEDDEYMKIILNSNSFEEFIELLINRGD